VGKNRTTVNNYIRLLKLPPVIQAALRDNKISMGHARAIINIENPDSQIRLFNRAVDEEWSVRKVEEAVRNLSDDDDLLTATRRVTLPKQEMRSLQFKLSSLFGTKVSIKADEKHKGEIKIPFTSQEELTKILEVLNSQT